MEHPGKDLIRLRPRQNTLYMSRGRMVLAAKRDGFIQGGADRGLFVYQTRVLSSYRYLIDGKPLHPVAQSNIDQHTWLGYYTQVPPGGKKRRQKQPTGIAADIPGQHVVEVRLRRWIDTHFHEEVQITNHTQKPTSFTLELEVGADFADPKETRKKRKQQGGLTKNWETSGKKSGELRFDYQAEHSYDHQGEKGTAKIHRGCRLRIREAGAAPVYDEDKGSISFRVELKPKATWQAKLELVPELDDMIRWHGDGQPREQFPHGDPDALTKLFRDESTRFHTGESRTLAPTVAGALERARRDLSALRLFDLDHGKRAWTMTAGIPLYIALFGRDTLTTAWQAAMLGPEMMTGTLEELARWQGKEENPWRGEQPGRMLHQISTGPLSSLSFDPFDRYYGSMTTSVFYAFVVSELWHWTGDRHLVGRLLQPALQAMEWLDKYGDLDGDGFYEYKKISKKGVKNQGWKDSGEALVYEDGTQVKDPIAPCELQGFVYASKRRLAELCWWMDKKEEAKKFYREAEELKKRFNEKYWVEKEGYYAMGLGPKNKRIKSVGSDPGHCLATNIVDKERVHRVVARMFQEDLFSGWGFRTLSSKHPAYNPYSYQRGSVWPVEHGTFALAMMRYGLHGKMHKICKAQFEAAALFDHYRLPEVISGHQRTREQPFPAVYPHANMPQAWSASGVLCMVQALLGIYPYAPLNLLLVDPHLPEWLPELTVEKMRVGEAKVTIRFYRKADGSSSYEVQEKQGQLHVVRQPSPWSLTAGYGERMKDALLSMVPGK